MKRLTLFLSLLYFTLSVSSQETLKIRDIIYLKNGETIETRIIRVNNRKIYYYHPKTYKISEISRDKVLKYDFNDDFFQTNKIGNLQHSEVIKMDGFNKDEIYRAIKDWFFVNSRSKSDGIFLDDSEHLILLGLINTSDYIKLDFLTVLSAFDDNPQTNTYTLRYNVNLRIKDNRFKVYITEFAVQSNMTIYDKLLKRTYEKRKTKDGVITIHGREIENLKTMITKQISEIEEHCKLVRLNDTYHNRIVKQALMDDDW